MIRAAALILAICLSWAGPAWAQGPTLDPGPMNERASALLEDGRLLEAVDAWQAVYEHAASPADRARALVRRADVMALFLDRGPEALDLYDRAVDEFGHIPETANAVCNAAMVRYERGDYAGAVEGFEACLRHWPNGPGSATASYMRERAARDLAQGAAPPQPNQFDQGLSGTKGTEPLVRVLLARGTDRASVAAKAQSMRAGDLRLVEQGGRVLAVDSLPLERYLRGVVPREMPASWPAQALRAQAVAARTYALYLLLRSEDKAYDVTTDTGSQVYGGPSAYKGSTDAAVAATRGLVLSQGGRPILAYFHSHSGGSVEDDARVWSTDLPYLRAVADPDAQRARDMAWSWTAGRDAVARALRQQGYEVGAVTGLSPAEVSPTGRLARVRVDTDRGPLEIKGSALRLALGAGSMKSTLCTVRPDGRGGGGFVFQGRGFGHGVGLSQWGARGMADAGAGLAEILGRYYPGTRLTRAY